MEREGKSENKQSQCFNLLGAFAETDALQPTSRVTPEHEQPASCLGLVKQRANSLFRLNEISRRLLPNDHPD